MLLTTAEDGGLTVFGTGRSSFAGPLKAPSVECGALSVVGEEASSFNGPLTVRTSVTADTFTADQMMTTPYLFVRKSESEVLGVGSNQLFLALRTDETHPVQPDVNGSILFEHVSRYRHRIEARRDGIHFNTGDYYNDIHTSIVAGDVFVKGQIYNQSDARLKEDVHEISDALTRVGRLRGVHFAWNAEGLANLSPEARHAQLAGRTIGLIAQEVEDVAPELVHTDARRQERRLRPAHRGARASDEGATVADSRPDRPDRHHRAARSLTMENRIAVRLDSLRKEYETGQSMLAELESKALDLRQTLLRIAGAIQVLEELLAETDASPNGHLDSPAREEPASA